MNIEFSLSLKIKQNHLLISADILVSADILWSINLKCLYILIRTLKTHKVIHFFDQHFKLHLLRYIFLSCKLQVFFFSSFIQSSFIAEIFKPNSSCFNQIYGCNYGIWRENTYITYCFVSQFPRRLPFTTLPPSEEEEPQYGLVNFYSI